MRIAAFAVALVLAACGNGAQKPAPPSNRGGPAGKQELAIAKLHELAAAIRADGPIGPLADPQDGVWLWEQPGVAPQPAVHVAAGDPHKLHEQLASGGLGGARAPAWTDGLADAIDHGLDALDVDGDPSAPAHNIDCGADPMRRATRAMLVTKGLDLVKAYPDLADGPLARATTPLAFRFDFNQVSVYLSERDGALYVAHLIVSTPCEA